MINFDSRMHAVNNKNTYIYTLTVHQRICQTFTYKLFYDHNLVFVIVLL